MLPSLAKPKVETILYQHSLIFFAEGPKDTKANDVAAKSYVPSLLTFEEEIANALKLSSPS